MDKGTKCCSPLLGEWGCFKRCAFDAKVERDGKPYCGRHDPERIAAMIEEADAIWVEKFRRNMAAEAERDRRLARYDEAIKIIDCLCSRWTDVQQFTKAREYGLFFLSAEPEKKP